MRSIIRIFALLTLSVNFSAFAQASFRCGENVVDEGLTLIEVLERCGAPDFQYHRPTYLVPGVFIEIDEWLYESGHNKFRRLLTFENGRLVRIELRDKPRMSLDQLKSGL